MDDKQLTELFLKLERLEFQIGRLVSDAESEKEFRKERNIEVERRLREIDKWKSELHGKIVVSVFIVGLLCTLLIGIVVKVIA